jgi:hypothetical protein
MRQKHPAAHRSHGQSLAGSRVFTHSNTRGLSGGGKYLGISAIEAATTVPEPKIAARRIAAQPEPSLIPFPPRTSWLFLPWRQLSRGQRPPKAGAQGPIITYILCFIQTPSQTRSPDSRRLANGAARHWNRSKPTRKWRPALRLLERDGSRGGERNLARVCGAWPAPPAGQCDRMGRGPPPCRFAVSIP